ncbi:hypothetical protein DUI87_17847 [Hirundo rustica rustica]|uniref:Uncharacterized protein n=1 Tax=Hirundo rustica rustica TaxID=333673 RepID=A0A3M0KBX1_HIRRU|nr:hypothetical protein DUI87_17847 [Hirundo rustica rustica]
MDQAEEQEYTNNHSQEEKDGQRDWKHIDGTIPVLLRECDVLSFIFQVFHIPGYSSELTARLTQLSAHSSHTKQILLLLHTKDNWDKCSAQKHKQRWLEGENKKDGTGEPGAGIGQFNPNVQMDQNL